ncbi:hypothetical protein WA026_001123 [Henosepilachna vigintioctopunctata]|uniref:Endonuclease/exonuclease/phosphatase domain-containing protein n=1 Tax=Henosepilachna vigintioctopunctata TaxID=420089 RepID=A0AAW1V9B9_9CUCU
MDLVQLRFLPQTGQCEMVVKLNVVFEGININEEIHSVRKITDTIGSLIEHTKNKLTKIINDKKSTSDNQITDQFYDIPVSFKRKSHKHSKVFPNDESLQLFLLEDHDKTIVQIFDKKFLLQVNPPLIKNIQLPKILYASYVIQPSKFHALYTNKVFSHFTWYKSLDLISWEEVGNSYDYTINKNDLGHYLKVVCVPVSDKLSEGPPAEAISQRTVQEFPELPMCPFQSRHQYTKNILQKIDFRFLTYNTLSNRYTEMNLAFSYCPSEVLAIDYRKQLIYQELKGYNADIICLQEIDNREYNNYFREKLSELGYVSKFHRKGHNISEGLLCATRKTRYQLLSCQQVVLTEALRIKKLFEPLNQLLNKNRDLKKSFMKQSTSLQVTTLKCKEVNRIMVIGNTHLYYHPSATAIRLLQAHIITSYLSDVKKRMSCEWKNFEVDVILCGDFNSSPGGAIYNFLSEGSIPADNEFCLQISEEGKVNFSHELNFISACGTPKYTNYTDDFKSCLDYIFIQEKKIEVKQIIPLPEEELEQYIGLPNEVYPSDHVALVVDLQFKDQI